MANEHHGIVNLNHRSHRRTTLCYLTLCLCVCLLIFLFFSEVFRRHYSHSENAIDQSMSFNVLKYRSSLIRCGQSFVENKKFFETVERLMDALKNMADRQRDTESLNITEQIDTRFTNGDFIERLEYILERCFQVRQFSMIEQHRPTLIRRLISMLRREFLYVVGFFIKDN